MSGGRLKILSIGSDIDHDIVNVDTFSSSRSFLDYDIVILDPSQVLYEYASDFRSGTYRGLKSLAEDSSARLVRDIDRRRNEMGDMLGLGRSLVVFNSPPQKCYVDTGKREYSGTGKNRQTTRIMDEVDVFSSLPVETLKTVEASGHNLEFRGREPFASFWNDNKDFLSYKAYFQKPVGEPLFFIKGTNKAVGSYSRVGNGILLFAPTFLDEESDVYNTLTEDETIEADRKFVNSLVALIEELRKDVGDFELPLWSKDYVLPEELKKKNELLKLNGELSNLLAKTSEKKESIAELETRKILFTGSGTALENQVRQIFEELGFDVVEAGPGRDDLILKCVDKIAVVEIKGVSKSAAEKHAAQLEKWVSEYYSNHGVHPKGILVINAYCDTPLKDRKNPAFPDQMLGYSERRGHCLLTGIQLLSLFLDCQDDQEKKDATIDRVFSTEGIFKEYRNWPEFLILDDERLKEE